MIPTGLALDLFALRPGTGYGDAAVAYAMGLVEQAVPLRWTPFEYSPAEPLGQSQSQQQLSTAAASMLCPLVDCELQPDVLLINTSPGPWHRQLIESTSASRRYAYVAWELERIPGDWPGLLDGVDGIFVPTEFNAHALRDGGIEAPLSMSPDEVSVGPSISGYRISDPLGEGAFGIVYEAEQIEPVRRKVAPDTFTERKSFQVMQRHAGFQLAARVPLLQQQQLVIAHGLVDFA